MEVLDELQDSYEKYLVSKADRMHIPLGATFELSPLCNFRCRMCYIEQKQAQVVEAGGLQPVDFWLNLARQAVEAGTLYVLLTGGETLMYPGFRELYKGLKQLGMYIIINTNGSLLDEDMIHFLGEDPPKRLNVSLYGASHETYERLCGQGQMFRRVLHNLESIKEYNKQFYEGLSPEEIHQKQPGIPLRIHTMLTPDNYEDYEGIVAIANRLQLPLAFVPYVFPSVRKGDASLNLQARFDACTAGCMKFRNQMNAHIENPAEHIHKILDQVLNYQKDPYYGLRGVACRGGISSYWVNWKGQMSSCGMIPGPWFDLKKNTFDTCWQKVRQATDQLQIHEDCAVCPKRSSCQICAASAYAETGDFAGKPQYLCDMTDQFLKLIEKEAEKYTEG